MIDLEILDEELFNEEILNEDILFFRRTQKLSIKEGY